MGRVDMLGINKKLNLTLIFQKDIWKGLFSKLFSYKSVIMPLISHVSKIVNIHQTNGEFIHSCIHSLTHLQNLLRIYLCQPLCLGIGIQSSQFIQQIFIRHIFIRSLVGGDVRVITSSSNWGNTRVGKSGKQSEISKAMWYRPPREIQSQPTQNV